MPVTIPSENLLSPIRNILNILKEYDVIQNNNERISYEILYELQIKSSDMITKNSGPIIKSRSSSVSSYSTELSKSLLLKLNVYSENYETLFQEASSFVKIAEGILKQGYEYVNHLFLFSLFFRNIWK